MADKPIIEQLCDEIVEALEAVTHAAGYDVEVNEVIRPKRTGIDAAPGNHDIVMIQGNADRAREQDWEGVEFWSQRFELMLCLRQSDSSTEPIDDRLNRFAAAVHKKIYDEYGDTNFDDLAVDVEETERSYATDSDGAYEAIVCGYDFVYRHKYGDPYSKN